MNFKLRIRVQGVLGTGKDGEKSLGNWRRLKFLP